MSTLFAPLPRSVGACTFGCAVTGCAASVLGPTRCVRCAMGIEPPLSPFQPAGIGSGHLRAAFAEKKQDTRAAIRVASRALAEIPRVYLRVSITSQRAALPPKKAKKKGVALPAKLLLAFMGRPDFIQTTVLFAPCNGFQRSYGVDFCFAGYASTRSRVPEIHSSRFSLTTPCRPFLNLNIKVFMASRTMKVPGGGRLCATRQ